MSGGLQLVLPRNDCFRGRHAARLGRHGESPGQLAIRGCTPECLGVAETSHCYAGVTIGIQYLRTKYQIRYQVADVLCGNTCSEVDPIYASDA